MRMITSTNRALLAVPGLVLAGAASGAVFPAGAATPAPDHGNGNGNGNGEVTIQSCSHDWSNKDSGAGHVDADWLMRRSGPHTYCGAYGQSPDGTKIYYHCYVGIWPNSWTHGRVAGTDDYGWFADKYLSDDGATTPC